MSADMTKTKEHLLDAALLHVVFDGWSEATFLAAIADTGMSAEEAQAACPRGAVDLALAYHARGDAEMLRRLQATDLSNLKFSEKVAAAVRFRLEAADDKEAVRRGVALFSLPHHAADGAGAVWQTCDHIWTALGDPSRDGNWYSKRATLSAVYSATLLYWLGDDTPGHQATWDFLDRRIANVMQIEKFKAQARKNPLLKPLIAGPDWLMGQMRAPGEGPADNLPGNLSSRR